MDVWNPINEIDWVVGDQIYTPKISGDALRSLADPTKYGQPDHMDNYVNTNSDYGGVHTNSGIPNKAAFLIAKSIGLEKTAKIYYKALTDIMTPKTNFEQAYYCLTDAANALGYGSDVTNAIQSAYTNVGIIKSTTTDPVPDPNGIYVEPNSVSLIVKQNYQLKAFSSLDNKQVTVSWSSDNARVASVDSNGLVTAKSAGAATISAKLPDGKSASCILTVKRK